MIKVLFRWMRTSNQKSNQKICLIKYTLREASRKLIFVFLKTFIPPLLVNKRFVTDFKVKANIFNDFFSKQCTPLANGSKIPENQVYLTNSRINSILFSGNLVIKIIRNLNVNKVHVHYDISMRMIEMCGEFLVRPLSIIIPNSCIYPRTCKKQTWYQFINKMTGNLWWQLPPCVASTSIWENFWKINLQWNLYFSW